MTGTSSGSGNANINKQFGLMIAYVLPGFIGLAGLAPLFPGIARWLRPIGGGGDLGLGAPVYALLAATAAGLILSCFRWALLDQIHQRTGVTRPRWDDSQLESVLGGFDYLVQSHFRYYEFCGNTLVALLVAYGLNRALGTLSLLGTGTDVAVLLMLAVMFAASRDALSKYYRRTELLIGEIRNAKTGDQSMYNGNDHTSGGGGGASTPKPRPENKPEPQPASPGKPSQPKDLKGQQGAK
jgi:hypothetical protein